MLSRFSVPAAPRPFIFDIDQALFIHFIFLNCCASIFLIISSLGAERMDNIPTTCIHHHHPSQYSPMPIPMPELERLRSMLSNVKVEAGFSKVSKRAEAYHRYLSKDTTPVTEATSSWDSDSDAEIVGTIHTKEDPWFFVEERCVLLKTKLDDVIDDFEEACDDDTPLSFRPFMSKAIQGLRKDLAERLTTEFLLSNADPGAPRYPELTQWTRDVVFPVKRPRRDRASRPSDSPEW